MADVNQDLHFASRTCHVTSPSPLLYIMTPVMSKEHQGSKTRKHAHKCTSKSECTQRSLTGIEWAYSIESSNVVMVPVGDDDLADSSLQLLQSLPEQTDILWLVGLTGVNQDTAAQGWYDYCGHCQHLHGCNHNIHVGRLIVDIVQSRQEYNSSKKHWRCIVQKSQNKDEVE